MVKYLRTFLKGDIYMNYSHEVENMCIVKKDACHKPAPIPQEGKWTKSTEIKDINGSLTAICLDLVLDTCYNSGVVDTDDFRAYNSDCCGVFFYVIQPSFCFFLKIIRFHCNLYDFFTQLLADLLAAGECLRHSGGGNTYQLCYFLMGHNVTCTFRILL